MRLSLAKKLSITAVVLVVAIQFYPIERTNPSIEGEIQTSDNVHRIFRRACYDCHSNNTQWRWYSYAAPASWLMVRDVEEGRKHLNFSSWNLLDLEKEKELRHEIWEEIDHRKMPPWLYEFIHSGTELSEGDKEVLRLWSQTSNGPKTGTDVPALRGPRSCALNGSSAESTPRLTTRLRPAQQPIASSR